MMWRLNHCKEMVVLTVLVLGAAGHGQAARKTGPPPDLTHGGTADKSHDWNLGATGARGWIWGRSLETIDARQILITRVDRGSPADGVLEVGDVILGVNGTPFNADARRCFGRAVTRAEATDGVLKLIRWRKGEQNPVQLHLRVLGPYSPTAPWHCAKSQQILDAGCRHIATHMKGGIDGLINTLALLASGKKEYQNLVRDYARKLAPADLKLKVYGGNGMVSWHWGYTNLFLTEYYLATGDRAVLPAIKQYAIKLAQGQSGVGTWGHGLAWPDINGGRLHGRLGGYGALNQAGLVCHLSLILAEQCGVRDAEVRQAIERANQFFGFYIGKGTIPYGDHRPGWQVHDDNGKNSIATVLFDVENRPDGARFFSRMVVASYGERERGHTGNYFSFLWGPLAANRAGPDAAAAFLKELRWYFDLARTWKGNFVYQGGAGSVDKYSKWDCTGAYLLAYALPLGRLYLTGRGTHPDNRLSGAALASVIEAGRGFNSWTMGIDVYRHKSIAELMQCLRSWSPAVRHRAAEALAERQGDFVAPLLKMLKSDDRNARLGACKALGALKGRAAPAVDALVETLSQRDLWLRIQAVYALSSIGPAARVAVPALLRAAARIDAEDSHQMLQRYLAFGLFYPGGALGMRGIICHDLRHVDRRQLYEAVKVILNNPDGRARGTVGSIYNQLTYDELKPILPAIVHAVKEPSPSGVMFASGIRLSGLKLLAKHHIAEGMPLCLEIMDIEGWGKRHRISTCLNILQMYGGAAKPMIPKLHALEKALKQHREAKGLKPQIDLVRQTIAKITADRNPPELRSIRDI